MILKTYSVYFALLVTSWDPCPEDKGPEESRDHPDPTGLITRTPDRNDPAHPGHLQTSYNGSDKRYPGLCNPYFLCHCY